MAYEQVNIPLAGDILDDLAMAFRELISKVGVFSLKKFSCSEHIHKNANIKTILII